MIYKFDVNMQDATLHNLKAPWLKLHNLTGETELWTQKVSDYFDAIESVDNYEDIGNNEVSWS